MTDLRKQPRSRSMLGAQIVFNDNATKIECRVRNISPTGVKIAVGEYLAFPARFELQVPQRGETYEARLVWRHSDEAGLEFVTNEPASTSPEDLARRVQQLEAENAALRRKANDLKAQLDRYYDQA